MVTCTNIIDMRTYIGKCTHLYFFILSTEMTWKNWYPSINECTYCPEFGFQYHSPLKEIRRSYRNVNYRTGASQVVLVVKNLPTNAGDLRAAGSIPMSGRSPGGGDGDPLQYSCLKKTMDRRAWWAAVHRVAQSQTRLKHPHMHNYRTRVRNEASYSTRK